MVGLEGQMQSTAAAANSQWVFQTPVDVNLSIYLSSADEWRSQCASGRWALLGQAAPSTFGVALGDAALTGTAI